MLKERLNIGVIGAGYIAGLNVPALLQTGRVNVAAVVSRTKEGAQALIEKQGLGCPAFGDYREMVGACRLDAVLIQSPHDLHREQFLYCASHGLDAIVEKPLAASSADCREMIQAKDRFGVRAAVCHTQRYGGAIMAAKAFMDANALGAPVHAEDLLHSHYFFEGRKDWMLSRARGGGIVLNYAVHQIDRVQYLIGERTRSVYGSVEARKPGVEVDSSYQMMGRTDTASYCLTCAGYAGPSVNRMTLFFTGGLLRVSLTGGEAGPAGVFWGETGKPLEPVAQEIPPAEGHYLRQMAPIVEYLRGDGAAPVVTLEYAAEVVRAAEALLESARTGRAVLLG